MPPRIHVGILGGIAAFTLVELLSVIAVITMMTVASAPVIQSLTGSSSASKTIEDLSGAYEMARIYAMTHHTYTRVGIARVSSDSSVMQPTLVVATIYSVDGSLTNDDATSMADDTKWRLTGNVRGFGNFWLYDSLQGATPSTAGDSKPSDTDIDSFSRFAGRAGVRSFGCIVQFNPAGEARVLKSEPARYIKIGVDQPLNPSTPDTPRSRNPFILRLSGINGSVNVIRKENIQ
ncbi:MAG: Tfp pilus assembly protein FimT/FimU [Chthoniobacteraceae bacterium]